MSSVVSTRLVFSKEQIPSNQSNTSPNTLPRFIWIQESSANQQDYFPISSLVTSIALPEATATCIVPRSVVFRNHLPPTAMTASNDFKSMAAAAQVSQATPNSEMTHQPPSRQQTPSQSYFSASPSPPPSTPPPPPPPMSQNVPFIKRVMDCGFVRYGYVQLGFKELEGQELARRNGEPIPAFNASALKMRDFKQESSNEGPIERFCVWDTVEDPNVIHARMAMAAFEQRQNNGSRAAS